jgi:hypothetical protein
MIAGRLRSWLFFPDSDRWLGILRVGLGLQVTLYAWSLRLDWSDLFSTHGNQPFSRALAEAILSVKSSLIPKLGWLVAVGEHLGMTESTVLSAAWLALLFAGVCLILGLFSKATAIVAWFLYLSCAKSGLLFDYGVDQFTTIGLFYLMLAPLPDRFALESRWRKTAPANPIRLGFERRVLQLHLCFIYFFSGLSKTLSPDWWNGNGIWQALTRPPFDLIPPAQLIRFEFFFPALGIGVCLLELGYPFFIWPRHTRLAWLIAILSMHLAIGLTMGLYLFALIMIVLNLAAFGPEFLVTLKKSLLSQRFRGIIETPV